MSAGRQNILLPALRDQAIMEMSETTLPQKLFLVKCIHEQVIGIKKFDKCNVNT